jgi:hypothetical protein
MRTCLTTFLLCTAIILIAIGTHTFNIIATCIGVLVIVYNVIIDIKDKEL